MSFWDIKVTFLWKNTSDLAKEVRAISERLAEIERPHDEMHEAREREFEEEYTLTTCQVMRTWGQRKSRKQKTVRRATKVTHGREKEINNNCNVQNKISVNPTPLSTVSEGKDARETRW